MTPRPGRSDDAGEQTHVPVSRTGCITALCGRTSLRDNDVIGLDRRADADFSAACSRSDGLAHGGRVLQRSRMRPARLMV